MIHVERLQKRFGNVHAVDDVSFDVARGEVVGLLGPNGAGKTTTMRIVTGFLDADDGLVTVNGLPVYRDNLKTKALIGYLPESAPLYQDMEVVEFLSYIAKLKSVPDPETPKHIGEMVDVCGLKEIVGREIGKLSKGFRQRVGLAAAMIDDPPILVLDEPTSGLDPNQIAEIRELIRKIGKERTVVLSTHIMQEVEAVCDRAIIISAGKLVGHGTIEELRKHSGARASYTASIRATRERIEDEIKKLSGLYVAEWLSEGEAPKQRFTLRCDGTDDRSEDIFKWAVANNLVMSELTHETASLEDVFRQLTQG